MFITRSVLLLFLVFSLTACIGDQSKLKKGAVAPSLKTKTLYDVNGDFSRITSYRYPDARMYQLSVDVALTQGKPIVLAFATPGHCTVCDKQLQILKGLLEIYDEQITFIHIDQYFNPQAFKAFEVKGDPWTFVIGKDKKIAFRRAGRMLYLDLESQLKAVL